MYSDINVASFEPRWDLCLRARAVLQAKQASTGIAFEMGVAVVNRRDAEAPYAVLARYAMCQALCNKPVEDAVERNLV